MQSTAKIGESNAVQSTYHSSGSLICTAKGLQQAELRGAKFETLADRWLLLCWSLPLLSLLVAHSPHSDRRRASPTLTDGRSTS